MHTSLQVEIAPRRTEDIVFTSLCAEEFCLCPGEHAWMDDPGLETWSL